jgi:hypothetical protein
MSVTPRVSLVAWEDRQAGFIFVAVPDERGRYLRTDRSVAVCECRHCGSLVGEPCKGRNGYGGTTHVRRRALADLMVQRGYRPDDLLCTTEMPPPVPDEWMEACA